MKKGDQTRARLVETAGELIQRHGYHGVSLSEIVRQSGAPRGSLYFHFPGGKEQLAAEALAFNAERWKGVLQTTLSQAPTVAEGIRTACAALATQLAESGYRRGCPLATATLEAASDSDVIQQLSARHYASWERTIGEMLARLDRPPADPARFARLALSAIEGALLLARAYRDPAPLTDAAEMLVAGLER